MQQFTSLVCHTIRFFLSDTAARPCCRTQDSLISVCSRTQDACLPNCLTMTAAETPPKDQIDATMDNACLGRGKCTSLTDVHGKKNMNQTPWSTKKKMTKYEYKIKNKKESGVRVRTAENVRNKQATHVKTRIETRHSPS